MNGNTLIMLYDSGATHLFIFFDCVNRLKLPIFELPYDLSICTPIGKPVRITQVYLRCPFWINDRVFTANLICLSLFSLELILGMDWLLANHVMLNCSNRPIVFPSTFPSKPLTSMCLYLNSLGVNHCETDSQGYVLFSASAPKSKQRLSEILVVREYPNVFPEDIP